MAVAEKCTTYTKRWVDINFSCADNEISCSLCPLLQTYSRPQCMRTGELIYNAKGTGVWCPLLAKDGDTFSNPYTGEIVNI